MKLTSVLVGPLLRQATYENEVCSSDEGSQGSYGPDFREPGRMKVRNFPSKMRCECIAFDRRSGNSYHGNALRPKDRRTTRPGCPCHLPMLKCDPGQYRCGDVSLGPVSPTIDFARVPRKTATRRETRK
jgi:hypothetical protein